MYMPHAQQSNVNHKGPARHLTTGVHLVWMIVQNAFNSCQISCRNNARISWRYNASVMFTKVS